MLWTPNGEFHIEPYANESELENAVREVSPALFGTDRIYLDTKKKIGTVGKTVNIPDGYLIDLSSTKQPLLYVVENELAEHHHLKHIAVQILEFSLSFEATPQAVKSIVRSALNAEPQARQRCEQYAQANGFDNVDYLLDRMVYGGGFQALVIIDELEDELEAVLVRKFKFGVEVLTLTRYANAQGERMYQFEPFLADVTVSATASSVNSPGNGQAKTVDPLDIDTIVVPARDEGFQEEVLGQHRWHHVRIHSSIIPKLKYVAIYRVLPISAITHLAPVRSIEPWQTTGYYVLNFAEPAQPIGPLKLVPGGKVKTFQSARYTSHERLTNAKTLDEAF